MSDEQNSTSASPSTEIVVSPIVELIAPVEQIKAAWDRFKKLKQELLDDSDYQEIWVKIKQPDGTYKTEKRKFIKRSGFRKFALAFGLSDGLLDEKRIDRPDGSFMWKVKVRVTHPNGRCSEGVGACDSRERGFAHAEHDVYATAHTRAKSRAISDLVAGGVVSAEEIETVRDVVTKNEVPTRPKQIAWGGEKCPACGNMTLYPFIEEREWVIWMCAGCKHQEKVPRDKKGEVDQPVATQQQIRTMNELCRTILKETGVNLEADIFERYNVKAFFNMTRAQANEAIGWLRQQKKEYDARPKD